MPKLQSNFVYALVYVDDEGKEHSIWYRTKEAAERAAQGLKRQCAVKLLKV